MTGTEKIHCELMPIHHVVHVPVCTSQTIVLKQQAEVKRAKLVSLISECSDLSARSSQATSLIQSLSAQLKNTSELSVMTKTVPELTLNGQVDTCTCISEVYHQCGYFSLTLTISKAGGFKLRIVN